MLFRLLVLVVVYGLAGSAFAEDSKCLLWEMKGEHNRVFLLGSIHMMRSEDYPLDRCVDAAYDKAEVLVVELNVLVINPGDMGLKMRELGMLPAGESLKDQLQPPTWQLLSQYKELPMGFEQMRPWLLALNLTLQKAAELGYRSDLGVDYYLLSKAMGMKPIINLETLELQLGVLSGDSALEQDLTLRLTLEQLPDMSSYINEVREAWQRGDMESIYDSIEQPKRDYPELAEQFHRQVTRRNLHMARQIADFLQDKEDYLVVIGGGHLGGDEGVLALLKKQGVEAVQQPKLGRSMLY